MRLIISALIILALLAVQTVDDRASATPQPAPAPSADKDAGDTDVPPLVQGYMQAGITKMQAGDYRGAVEQFTFAIEADPGLTDAYRGRAAAYDSLGDYQQAAADYTQVLARAQDDADAVGARGEDRYRLGDYAGADADLTAFLKKNPQNAEVYMDRGYARLKEGDAAGAVADFRRAIRLDPNNIDLHTALAAADLESHDLKAASADLDWAVHANPKSSPLLKMRMQVRMMMGNSAGALDDAQRMIKAGTADASVYEMACNAEANANQYDRARATCEEAAKRNPKDAAGMYRTLERIDMMADRPNAQLDDLNALVRLEPQSADAYYSRAMFEEDHGKKADAANDLRKALKIYKAAGDMPLVQQVEDLLRQFGD